MGTFDIPQEKIRAANLSEYLQTHRDFESELKQTKLMLCFALEALGGTMSISKRDLIDPPQFELVINRDIRFEYNETWIGVRRIPVNKTSLVWDSSAYFYDNQYKYLVDLVFHNIIPYFVKTLNLKENY